MTHDELLAKISLGEKFEGTGWSVDGNLLIKQSFALRAVVKLHKPIQMKMPDGAIYCMGCGRDHEFDDYWINYPCPTIQAIEKELA